RIIASIDQPSGEDPIVIPLRYASALDVAQTVNRLFPEAPQAPGTAVDPMQRLIVVADTRSNSLIARLANPARLARLRQFVAMLDAPASATGNRTVVYLTSAEAVKVAETLRAIHPGESAPAPAPPPISPGPPSLTPAAASLPTAASA